MADANAAGQNSAEEAARREAEEAARRAEEARRREIMEKIRQLEQEKAGCEGLKADYQGMNGRLDGIITQINGLKAQKLEADMQQFSGVSADEVDAGVSSSRAVMGKRNGRFFDIEAAARTQITLLDSYIAELAGRIGSLRASI